MTNETQSTRAGAGNAVGERKAFDEFCRKRWGVERIHELHDDKGGYSRADLQLGWEAWQQRAAAPAVSAPAGWIETIKLAHDESLDDDHAACRTLLREVIAQMEAAKNQAPVTGDQA